MTTNDHDKLKRLLTDWGDTQCGRSGDTCLTIPQAARFVADGASDAGQAEHVRVCPACARLVGRLEADRADLAPRPRRYRWLPRLVAAAVVVAALPLAVFVKNMSLNASRAEAERRVNEVKQAKIVSLTNELDSRQQRVEQLQQELATAAGHGSEAMAVLQRQIALQRDMADATKRHVEQLTAILDGRDELLAAARVNAQKLDERIAGYGRDLAALRRQYEGRTESLAAEVVTLTDRIEQIRSTRAARADADRQLWRALLPTGSQPRVDDRALTSIQAAARAARLADQAAALADAKTDPSSGELLNRLEAVLLRLEMADPADPAEQQWLSRLVTGATLGEIDAKLSDATTPLSDDERVFLTHMHMILLRGASAG